MIIRHSEKKNSLDPLCIYMSYIDLLIDENGIYSKRGNRNNMIKFVRLLIDYYHGQGMPHGGGAGKNSRYFMYLAKEELQNFSCCGMVT